jgi:hypothetical protein
MSNKMPVLQALAPARRACDRNVVQLGELTKS